MTAAVFTGDGFSVVVVEVVVVVVVVVVAVAGGVVVARFNRILSEAALYVNQRQKKKTLNPNYRSKHHKTQKTNAR